MYSTSKIKAKIGLTNELTSYYLRWENSEYIVLHTP